MSYSSNEVMALAAKAARGAGAPPAQAAQFGAAAAAHLGAGGDISVLAAALVALPMGPLITLPLNIAQIAETARDGQGSGQIAVPELAIAPAYTATLPYLAGITDDGILSVDLNTPAKRAVTLRIDLPQETYLEWSALAARLLVPESDASRQSGAGAGLSDND